MASITAGEILLPRFQQRVGETIAVHKAWYNFQGLALIVLGLLAMALPTLTALSFEVLTGSLLMISGLVKGYTSFKSHIHWWSFLSAALFLTAGGLLLWQPVPGVIALATVLAVFLLAEGVIEICLALEFESVKNWGWLLLSGLISLLLSTMLFIGWPGLTISFLGIMIGVNLLCYGASLLTLSASTPKWETL